MNLNLDEVPLIIPITKHDTLIVRPSHILSVATSYQRVEIRLFDPHDSVVKVYELKTNEDAANLTQRILVRWCGAESAPDTNEKKE